MVGWWIMVTLGAKTTVLGWWVLGKETDDVDSNGLRDTLPSQT